MKTTICFSLLLSLTVISCTNSGPNSQSHADTSASSSTSARPAPDVEAFVTKAITGGMLEVELGKLAQDKALNKRVKAFGKMMVTDHSKAGEELKALAAKKNISLPGSLTDEQTKEVNQLEEKSGVDFDKSYLKKMLADHRQDIKEFQDQAKKGTDDELKAFAAKMLDVLKTHFDSARSVNKEVKATVDPGDITDGISTLPLR